MIEKFPYLHKKYKRSSILYTMYLLFIVGVFSMNSAEVTYVDNDYELNIDFLTEFDCVVNKYDSNVFIKKVQLNLKKMCLNYTTAIEDMIEDVAKVRPARIRISLNLYSNTKQLLQEEDSFKDLMKNARNQLKDLNDLFTLLAIKPSNILQRLADITYDLIKLTFQIKLSIIALNGHTNIDYEKQEDLNTKRTLKNLELVRDKFKASLKHDKITEGYIFYATGPALWKKPFSAMEKLLKIYENCYELLKIEEEDIKQKHEKLSDIL